MGKIRIKAFDEASVEDDAKLKAKREAKKAEKIATKNEQRIAQGKKTNPQIDGTMSSTENETPVIASEETVIASDSAAIPTTETPVIANDKTVIASGSEAISEKTAKPATGSGEARTAKKEKFAKAKKKTDSKRHKENMSVVSKTQKYNLDQAIDALKKFKKSKFDETVELHINTKEKGISGQVTLPHGTGKTLVIKIADETILAEVLKGKINFDILVATPSMMPQLAKVARVLGPRGLMPNPKNGTITDKPEEAVKKLSGGQIAYKTESAFPIIHAIVGKVSFEDNKLKDNVNTFLSSVGASNITNVTLKSTMSPAIRLDYSTFIK